MSKKPLEVLYMIQESFGDANVQITESANSKKNRGLQFNATWQTAELPNRNKRVYKKSAMVEGINAVQPRVKNRRFFNEMSHPVTENIQRFSTIDMSNISHLITEFHWKDNLLQGTGETLNYGEGLRMKAMIEQDIPVEFSLRALGKTTKNPQSGLTEVNSNLKVFCFDWVDKPSDFNATMHDVITESVKDADISAMLLSESEKLQLLRESMDKPELEILVGNDNKTNEISYNLMENTVQFCSNGSCMKVFLEEFIRDEFKSSFSKFIK